jgi:hypothetical protein
MSAFVQSRRSGRHTSCVQVGELFAVQTAKQRTIGCSFDGPARCTGLDAVIDCEGEALLAPDIALRRLHGCMYKQELHLFELTAGGVTQAGAAAP